MEKVGEHIDVCVCVCVCFMERFKFKTKIQIQFICFKIEIYIHKEYGELICVKQNAQNLRQQQIISVQTLAEISGWVLDHPPIPKFKSITIYFIGRK